MRGLQQASSAQAELVEAGQQTAHTTEIIQLLSGECILDCAAIGRLSIS
jgi:hypothetical protein